MEERSTEMLEKAIQDGFKKLDTAKDTEDYCDKVKAVKDLYDLKNQEYKAQVEYYDRQEELELRKKELDEKEAHDAEQIAQDEKKRKGDMIKVGITVGATAALSLLTIIENHQGWIFKPDGFLMKLLNHDK